MKKKILAISLVVSLVAIAALGVTLAYFSETKTANNTFTVGNVHIRIDEPDWASSGLVDSPEVYPGERLNKDPSVFNTGANPCIVRVKVVMPAGFEDLISFETINSQPGTLGADWSKFGDYYYYMKPVAPGTATSELFQGVRFDKSLTNGDASTVRGIQVIAQAIQAQGIISGSYSTTIGNGIDETTELPTVIGVFVSAFGA